MEHVAAVVSFFAIDRSAHVTNTRCFRGDLWERVCTGHSCAQVQALPAWLEARPQPIDPFYEVFGVPPRGDAESSHGICWCGNPPHELRGSIFAEK